MLWQGEAMKSKEVAMMSCEEQWFGKGKQGRSMSRQSEGRKSKDVAMINDEEQG